MILKHRDTEVLRFEWVDPQGVRVVSVNGAAERFQPIDFRGSPTDANLWKWLVRRIVPSHRHYIQLMLAKLGLRDKNVRDLIGISKGLSLNDVYWVVGDASKALDRPGSPHDEFGDLRKFTSHIAPALYPHWLGFPGGLTPAMRARVAALKGFRFKRHENYNLSSYRLDKIEDFLQKRVLEIINYGDKDDELVEIAQENVVVKGKNEPNGTINVVVKDSTSNRSFILRDILNNLDADPFITAEELANLVGVTSRTVQRYLATLTKAGAVKRVGSDKTGHWSVDRAAFEMGFGGGVA